MRKKIKLIWAEKIRERLKGIAGNDVYPYFKNAEVNEFIKPILDYAEAEEKRINKAFKQKVRMKNEL